MAEVGNSQRALHWATGFTVGAVITASQFRPSGIPVAYVLLSILACWHAFRGRPIARSAATPIALWAIPAIYALTHDVLLGSGEPLQLAVRNSVGICLAWITAAQMRDARSATLVLCGLSCVLLVDVTLGIGQFFNQTWAIVLSLPIASLDALADLEPSAQIRSWGLHSFPHVYAYTVSMWVLVCGAFLALTQDTGGAARTFLRVCLAIGIVAVMLSAQRSAAWALIPALIAIVLLSSTHLMRTLATMIIVSLASILTVTGSLLLREDRNPVTRLLERESVASDSAREESWALALNVLDGDPYFGLAFRTYSGDIGVHNGFLAGWAEFGLGWLLAVLLCLLMTSRHFLIMPATLAARFAGLCFIGMMLVNAMFHTIMVSRNDMVFMSLFGMMLAITGLPSHASQERLPSGANINRQDMGQAPLSAP